MVELVMEPVVRGSGAKSRRTGSPPRTSSVKRISLSMARTPM
ncbi:hypothetical protein [Streptomyces sp. SID12488]|nr:hypothetical protein [Streptomyces sp. SID12488]